ncbi:protein BCAP-like isoform X1 [Hemibagrus wyckioides]|uniref:protein BCAP-like isoform X1 n=1 Tax=Hemibagrus wyckioides TaxID=337641 RepID=UPI00266BF417|nr:protein BCAP-like isoform X1 [Hemibagrus wyckioides]XP_058231255.1 protein BCAP-like isoform X1 [Hemibagrus wyckioides]
MGIKSIWTSSQRLLRYTGRGVDHSVLARPAMQFCSLHHCVLVFLILTFTTAPVSTVDVCPTRTKLHQSVTLSCKHQCSGLLQWNLISNRDDVLAECDRTSCRSEKGFNISHDQYLKGDLSLTITAADYSQRNVYACECGDIDYAFVRLIIETVFSPVQMKSGEDLKLHVSVPEPVEVIYKSSGSADEVICRVNNRSLQCKDKYRDRTSLTYPELTLRHMEPRDSGSYTIRDTKNEEDIQIYAVSVEEPAVPAWGIVLIVMSLLCCAAVGIYLLWRHRKRQQLNRRLQQVEKLIQQAEKGTEENISEAEMALEQLEKQYKTTEYSEQISMIKEAKKLRLQQRMEQLKSEELKRILEHVEERVQQVSEEQDISEVEMELNQLDQQYKNSDYAEKVKLFCMEKREQLLMRRQQLVEQLVQQAEGGTEENISDVEKSLDQLEQQYNNTEYSYKVKLFCMEKRKQLWDMRVEYVEQLVQQAKKEKIREVEMELDQLEQKYKNTEYEEKSKLFCKAKKLQLHQRINYLRREELVQQAEDGKKDISEVEKELKQLKSQYKETEYSDNVSEICIIQRSQLSWYRLQHSNEERLMTNRRELKWRMLHVEQLVQQAKEGTEEKIREAEEAIDELEQEYEDMVYSDQVSVLCTVKREQLKGHQYSKEECLITEDLELEEQMLQVKQRVHAAIEEGTEEKIREVEKEINQLEERYINTKDVVTVMQFCMFMRAELYWYRLQHSDKQLMTDKPEVMWKLEDFMNSLQKVRDGAEREQKTLSSTVVDKLQKHLMEFKMLYEEKRGVDK